MVELPFRETIIKTEVNSEIVTRSFNFDIDTDELKWHWDDEDRIIYPVHETDWMFQLDNRLPENINSAIKIPKGIWHRLIKGSNDLTIIVEKIKDI